MGGVTYAKTMTLKDTLCYRFILKTNLFRFPFQTDLTPLAKNTHLKLR